MMRAVFTFSILFFLTLIDSPGEGNQKHRMQAHADSISGHSIKINGKLNSVQIISDSTEWKNMDSKAGKPNDSHKIEINGEGNSVVITQKKGNKVKTIQNGTHNQINVIQSKPVSGQ